MVGNSGNPASSPAPRALVTKLFVQRQETRGIFGGKTKPSKSKDLSYLLTVEGPQQTSALPPWISNTLALPSPYSGFLIQWWLLLLRCGIRALEHGLSSCEKGLSCPKTCGISLDWGQTHVPLHGQAAGPQPSDCQVGSPLCFLSLISKVKGSQGWQIFEQSLQPGQDR